MEEGLVEHVENCAPLVRKRDLRKLGESSLARDLRSALRQRLRSPPEGLSPVLVGDALVRIFADVIETFHLQEVEGDTPQRRHYVYLSEYILQGNEWATVADNLGVARSTFYEIQKTALDALAAALWHLEEEAQMASPVLHNLDRPPYVEFIERFDSSGQSYRDEIIIPLLKTARAWILAIRGDPGVGKSSLAYAVAEKCVTHARELGLPFDAVVWIPCRSAEYQAGKDTVVVHSVPTSMPQVYDVIGKALGRRAVLQLTPEEKEEVVDELLQERTCLFVLDNLDSGWLPEELKQGIEAFIQGLPQPHKAIVTLRPEAVWVGQSAIELEPMNRDDLRRFMLMESRGKIPFAKSEFQLVYEKTRGNPLAMKQALSLVRVFGYSFDEALSYDKHSPGMLDFMYGKAYERLPGEAKKVLVAMPLFGDPVTSEALEAACKITGPEKVRAIGLLYRGQMIEKADDDDAVERYGLLPFTRDYLRKLRRDPDAAIGETPIAQFVEQAYANLVEYYCALLEENVDRIDRNLLLLKSDKHHVLSLMEWCWRNDRAGLVRLLRVVGIPLGVLRYLNQRKMWGERVVKVCHELGKPEEADWYLVRDVAWTLVDMGTSETRRQARQVLEEAKERASAEGWQRNLALILRNLGHLATLDGEYDVAQGYLEQSLRRWEKVGDKFWMNAARRAMAAVLVARGELESAKKLYTGLEMEYRRSGNTDGLIKVNSALALIAVKMGDCDQTRRMSDTCLEMAAGISPPALVLADASRDRSYIEELCGDVGEARRRASIAKAIYGRLGMTFHEEKMNERIAEVEGRLADHEDLAAC